MLSCCQNYEIYFWKQMSELRCNVIQRIFVIPFLFGSFSITISFSTQWKNTVFNRKTALMYSWLTCKIKLMSLSNWLVSWFYTKIVLDNWISTQPPSDHKIRLYLVIVIGFDGNDPRSWPPFTKVPSVGIWDSSCCVRTPVRCTNSRMWYCLPAKYIV